MENQTTDMPSAQGTAATQNPASAQVPDPACPAASAQPSSSAQPAASAGPSNQVRTFAKPLDTVSSATQELFEVRTSSSKQSEQGAAPGQSVGPAFIAIALVALVAVVLLVVFGQAG